MLALKPKKKLLKKFTLLQPWSSLRRALALRDVFINVFLQIYQVKFAHQVFFSIVFEKKIFYQSHL